MIDQILKDLDPDVINGLSNIGIPQQKTPEVLDLANSHLQDQFRQRAHSGDMSDLLDLFNGNQAIGQSSAVDGMIGNFAETIANKIGISPDIARTAAASLIPIVLSKLNERTPSSGLNEDHLSSILGGSSDLGGIAGKLRDLLG